MTRPPPDARTTARGPAGVVPALIARLTIAVVLAFAAPALAPPNSSGPLETLAGGARLHAQSAPTVVFLVRHAERAEDGTSDPPISEAGKERAALLAKMLRDADLTRIHTTDYRRTRATGRPTADAAGLEMTLYDADDLEAFAEELRRMPGRHLVLGHSNTTPPLVEALGGDPRGPIEELEYDRLYIVTLSLDGASTVLIRFGRPYEGPGP